MPQCTHFPRFFLQTIVFCPHGFSYDLCKDDYRIIMVIIVSNIY